MLSIQDFEMRPVVSSNIASVGYREDLLVLAVRFMSGSFYIYEGVPLHVYEEMITAPSVGSYFNNKIKSVQTGIRLMQ